MLYSLFIYQRTAGFAIWQKSFKDSMDQNQLQLYSSFFSAIQSFLKELATNNKTTLNSLDLGDIFVYITTIYELDLELVSIAEKKDQKILVNFHEKLVPLILKNKHVFPKWTNWDGDLQKFRVLDFDIYNVIMQFKGLIKGNTDFAASDLITTSSIVNLKQQQNQFFMEEVKNHFKTLETVKTPLEKREILQKIEYILPNINDSQIEQELKTQQNRVNKELKEMNEKTQYFIRQAKEIVEKISRSPTISSNSATQEQLRQVFLNIYSASSKVKAVGLPEKANELKELANIFMNQNGNIQHDIYRYLHEVLNLPENIDEILAGKPIRKQDLEY